MSDPRQAAGGRTWPYVAVGVLLPFAVVVLANAGEYEGGDVILVLGPLAAVFGGLVGVFVGELVNGHRRKG